jgi:GTP cyclohydrolase I
MEFNDDKVRKIAGHFAGIMETLGLDLSNPSLKDTPSRVARMYVNELCAGLDPDLAPTLTVFPNDEEFDQIVLVRNITLHSMCEHHFLPFTGVCHIAYLPTPEGQILGLSKFNRFAQYIASQPQVQERLTQTLYDKLSEVLQTEDVAVVISAKHLCCAIRGVKDVNSETLTSYLGGRFRTEPAIKEEFFNLLHLGK